MGNGENVTFFPLASADKNTGHRVALDIKELGEQQNDG
jgi:hypothetical protein